jgi:hypothetical protein
MWDSISDEVAAAEPCSEYTEETESGWRSDRSDCDDDEDEDEDDDEYDESGDESEDECSLAHFEAVAAVHVPSTAASSDAEGDGSDEDESFSSASGSEEEGDLAARLESDGWFHVQGCCWWVFSLPLHTSPPGSVLWSV